MAVLGPALLAAIVLCLPPPDMERRLAECCGEARAAAGVAAGGELLTEFWYDPGDASWTVTIMAPGGERCVLATGFDWHEAAPPRKAPL